MDSIPLDSGDKLFLRSRAFLALALFLIFAAGAVLAAFEAQTGEGSINYAWLAIVIVAVAGTFAFGMVLLRLARDLSFGEKRISQGTVKLEGEKGVVWIDGKSVPLPINMMAGISKGQKMKVYRAQSGMVLALEKD